MSDEKIDFEKEAEILMNLRNFPINTTLVADHKLIGKIERWGCSIAARVEESTIQRCYRILMTEKGGIERLYAEKEKYEI